MTTSPMLKGLLTGCMLCLGGAAFGQAVNAPSAAAVLQFKPRQADVAITTPTTDEVAGCKVEEIRAGGAIVGWHLTDGAKKQTLRKFFDSKGGKNIDTWSYYKDGVEVYRENDSNGDGKADQFRWINAGGMKWGVDVDADGKIDAWRMISAEELGHEVFQALAAGDFARYKALLISESEIQALKLGGEQAARIKKLQVQAKAQFDEVLSKHPALAKGATFLRVESGPPQCVPAEDSGAGQELIKYPTRSILYETAERKHDWFQTGEMLKVGAAWRVVELARETSDGDGREQINPQLQKLLTDLDALDKNPPPTQGAPIKNEKVQAHNRQRVAVIKQVLQVVDAKSKETWWKQLFDNQSAGAQAGDEAALKELSAYRAQLEASGKGSNLAAYAAYRELWGIYAPLMINTNHKDLGKIQEEWQDKLGKFVQAYPKCEDAPDALHQLAIGSEFNGQDETAKRWYRQIYTAFPAHHFAEKAKGAEKRLDLVGRVLELQGPTLSGQAYNIAQSKNKVVVVYYYASYVPVCVGDFARLKQTLAKHVKNVELVCVNLDDTDKAALEFLQTNNPVGIHLFDAKPGAVGQSSRLGVQYGINGLPTMFLVGVNGQVLNRTLQVSDLEEALRKAIP